jgi:hypothetical protein
MDTNKNIKIYMDFSSIRPLSFISTYKSELKNVSYSAVSLWNNWKYFIDLSIEYDNKSEYILKYLYIYTLIHPASLMYELQ